MSKVVLRMCCCCFGFFLQGGCTCCALLLYFQQKRGRFKGTGVLIPEKWRPPLVAWNFLKVQAFHTFLFYFIWIATLMRHSGGNCGHPNVSERNTNIPPFLTSAHSFAIYFSEQKRSQRDEKYHADESLFVAVLTESLDFPFFYLNLCELQGQTGWINNILAGLFSVEASFWPPRQTYIIVEL